MTLILDDTNSKFQVIIFSSALHVKEKIHLHYVVLQCTYFFVYIWYNHLTSEFLFSCQKYMRIYPRLHWKRNLILMWLPVTSLNMPHKSLNMLRNWSTLIISLFCYLVENWCTCRLYMNWLHYTNVWCW